MAAVTEASILAAYASWKKDPPAPHCKADAEAKSKSHRASSGSAASSVASSKPSKAKKTVKVAKAAEAALPDSDSEDEDSVAPPHRASAQSEPYLGSSFLAHCAQ